MVFGLSLNQGWVKVLTTKHPVYVSKAIAVAEPMSHPFHQEARDEQLTAWANQCADFRAREVWSPMRRAVPALFGFVLVVFFAKRGAKLVRVFFFLRKEGPPKQPKGTQLFGATWRL